MPFNRASYLELCTKPTSSVRRLNDFQKEMKTPHSLYKDKERFSKDTEGNVFAGGAQSFWKKSNKAEKAPQRYYLLHREVYAGPEYFSFEILNAIGFTSPKLRYTNESGDVASKGLLGFIPVSSYLEPQHHPLLKKIAMQFHLEEKDQYIYDKKTKKQHRLRGNMYGARLGALLVNDFDFQPRGGNCGFIPDGNHFRFAVIDKAFASLETYKTYEELDKSSVSFEKSRFPTGNNEQLLATAYQIQNLITEKGKEPSDLYKIFFNPRASEIFKKLYLHSFTAEMFSSINDALFDTIAGKVDMGFFNTPQYQEVCKKRETITKKMNAQFTKNMLIAASQQTEILTYDDAKKWVETMKSTFWQAFEKIAKDMQGSSIDFTVVKNKAIEKLYTYMQLKFDPCLQYESILHNAQLIVGQYEKQLAQFEAREELRYKIVYKAVLDLQKEHVTVSTDQFEDMVEDLRGPYYEHLFHDQKNKLIAENDLENTALIAQIKADFAGKPQNDLTTEETHQENDPFQCKMM